MIDLLVAGGWVMPLIVACSVVALSISIERYIALDRSKVAPPHLLATVWRDLKQGELNAQKLAHFLHGIDEFFDLSELVVNLPEAEGETVEPDKGLDIIITADGSMFLNGTPFPADAENLRAIIIEKTGSRRDIPVSIVADGDTRHAMVVMSMDTVSQLGFKRLSISTQRPAAGE